MANSQDIASEPVDLTDDSDYMDTGVLYEGRTCVACGDDAAVKGSTMCNECSDDLK